MAAVSHEARFSAYLDELSAGLGYADRAAGLHGYCRGLMLPLERKSVEPLAAHLDPLRTRLSIKRCTISWPSRIGLMRRCWSASVSTSHHEWS